MSVPEVNVQTAATFMASIGDIRRFSSPRKLVSYLGLDPRVHQSGSTPARHSHISKAGASETRHMLGEVAWKVTLTPGPLRAFFERIRARRGPQIAATATASQARRPLLAPADKRAGLRLRPPGDDPQQGAPARTPRRCSSPEGPQGRRRQQVEGAVRVGARALPASGGRLPAARQRLALERTTESGCGRDTGARIFWALEGQSRAADSVSPSGLHFASSVTRTRGKDPTSQGRRPLDFHPSARMRRASDVV
jgi:hypothetical protein